MKIDYTLYLVTDRKMMSAKTLPEAVEQAILGGCTMVQIREKEASSLDFYEQAAEVKKVTDKYDIPLIVNDRIDIALAVRAAGVHVGQSDIPAAVVRKIIPEDMLLGVSVTSLEEAKAARENGADYLGVGAMFSTKTKSDASLVSMEELARIRHSIELPIVVIGGVGKENASLFRTAGVDGLAVVSAVISRPDIRAAAMELRETFLHSERTSAGCS